MDSISATVCNGSDAGTDGGVGLHFTTTSNAVSLGDDDDFHNRCSTGELNKEGINDWEEGVTQMWDIHELGDCADYKQDGYVFRPQKDLKVRVFVKSVVFFSDSVKICNIRVSFAYPYLTNGNKTQWEWSGEEWVNGEGTWHTMTIIQAS